MKPDLRPGTLVMLTIVAGVDSEDEMFLYGSPARGMGHKVIAAVKSTELGVVISIIPVNLVEFQDPDNTDRNVLAMFGQKLGWISEVWLKPAGTKT